MPLTDLLQWAGANRKTGLLQLERNRLHKRLAFRGGRIIGCTSDDPPTLLGQFLLSKGKLTHDDLRAGLARQEQTREPLGQILCQMGLLNQDELMEYLTEKARETIFSLFEWSDAYFRFEEGGKLDPPYVIELDLPIEDVLLTGAQRMDELSLIKRTLHTSGIVLEMTGSPQRQVERSGMARRILTSIDGKRTLGEILLHGSASEFLVLKLLHYLHRKKIVAITEVREADPSSLTILDDPIPQDADAADPSAERGDESAASAGAGPDDPEREVDVARRMLGRGEIEAALVILAASNRRWPDNEVVRGLYAEAEAEFLATARGSDLSPDAVPVLTCPADEISVEGLPPDARYLINLIDGETNIKSMLWLAPLREVELLRALQKLQERGVVELRPSEAVLAAAVELTEGGEFGF